MAVLRLSSSVDASAGLMWQSLISDTTRTQAPARLMFRRGSRTCVINLKALSGPEE